MNKLTKKIADSASKAVVKKVQSVTEKKTEEMLDKLMKLTKGKKQRKTVEMVDKHMKLSKERQNKKTQLGNHPQKEKISGATHIINGITGNGVSDAIVQRILSGYKGSGVKMV